MKSNLKSFLILPKIKFSHPFAPHRQRRLYPYTWLALTVRGKRRVDAFLLRTLMLKERSYPQIYLKCHILVLLLYGTCIPDYTWTWNLSFFQLFLLSGVPDFPQEYFCMLEYQFLFKSSRRNRWFTLNLNYSRPKAAGEWISSLHYYIYVHIK